MKAVSCDLDMAPTLVASSPPFLNSISVGMPRMPYLGALEHLPVEGVVGDVHDLFAHDYLPPTAYAAG